MAQIMNKKLAQVESWCVQHCIRLTPLRLGVLALIIQSSSAIGAYEILRLLRQTKTKAEATTVYRVLEFLIDHHLIHRVESLNAYVPCSHFDDQHHSQFLLCKKCGVSSEISDHGVIQAIQECLKTQGFTIEHGITEIRGLCYSCSSQAIA